MKRRELGRREAASSRRACGRGISVAICSMNARTTGVGVHRHPPAREPPDRARELVHRALRIGHRAVPRARLRRWRAPSRSLFRRPGSDRTCARRGAARTRQSRRGRTRRCTSSGCSLHEEEAPLVARRLFVGDGGEDDVALKVRLLARRGGRRRTRSSPPCSSCRSRRAPRASRRGSRPRTGDAASGSASASTTSRCAFRRSGPRSLAPPFSARLRKRATRFVRPLVCSKKRGSTPASRRCSAIRSAAGRSLPSPGSFVPRLTVGMRRRSCKSAMQRSPSSRQSIDSIGCALHECPRAPSSRSNRNGPYRMRLWPGPLMALTCLCVAHAGMRSPRRPPRRPPRRYARGAAPLVRGIRSRCASRSPFRFGRSRWCRFYPLRKRPNLPHRPRGP